MRRFTVFLLFLAATACNSFYETSLAQFSKVRGDRIFAEEEQKDLQTLFRSLVSLTFQDAACSRIQEEVDANQTLIDVEKRYELQAFFIYTELLSVSARDIISYSKESPERNIALSVLSVWKEASSSTEEVDRVIFKMRKCYPKNL